MRPVKPISIYVVPKINIEHDGRIFALEIYGCEVGSPFYIFDGARYELKNEERHALEKVLGKEIRHGDDQADSHCMHTP